MRSRSFSGWPAHGLEGGGSATDSPEEARPEAWSPPAGPPDPSHRSTAGVVYGGTLANRARPSGASQVRAPGQVQRAAFANAATALESLARRDGQGACFRATGPGGHTGSHLTTRRNIGSIYVRQSSSRWGSSYNEATRSLTLIVAAQSTPESCPKQLHRTRAPDPRNVTAIGVGPKPAPAP